VYRDLKNKNIIVTGGSGFLGRQIVKAFKSTNSNIFILDITKPKISSNKIKYFECDITNQKKVLEVSKKIVKNFKVDVLINNAANDYKPENSSKSFLENFNINEWNNDIAVGLTGAFICTKIFGSEMSRLKRGVILNISSDLGINAPNQEIYKGLNFKKPATYSVVKHGIIGLTKFTATYWANKNIRCNAIAPGGIFNSQNKKFINKVKKTIPLKRLANKNEYNELILFLCSNSSSYITGTTIVADGGRSII